MIFLSLPDAENDGSDVSSAGPHSGKNGIMLFRCLGEILPLLTEKT
jgi:hypothetical protein